MDNTHRTAPECGILHIQNCFRRRVIANPINTVELYKNMNNSVENWDFSKSNSTIAHVLCIKAIKVYVMFCYLLTLRIMLEANIPYYHDSFCAV